MSNHAHNDYVELALETGFPGALLLLLFLAWWAASQLARMDRRWSPAPMHARRRSRRPPSVIHCLVDFPLRTATIAAVIPKDVPRPSGRAAASLGRTGFDWRRPRGTWSSVGALAWKALGILVARPCLHGIRASSFVEHAVSISHDSLHLDRWRARLACGWPNIPPPAHRLGPWAWTFLSPSGTRLSTSGSSAGPMPGMQFGEGAGDLALTMLLPTLLMLAAGHGPNSSGGNALDKRGEPLWPAGFEPATY